MKVAISDELEAGHGHRCSASGFVREFVDEECQEDWKADCQRTYVTVSHIFGLFFNYSVGNVMMLGRLGVAHKLVLPSEGSSILFGL